MQVHVWPYMPVTLFVVGGLISGFGAIVGAYQTIRGEKLRADSEHALRTKAEEIANLQSEMLSTVTGGESFCYVVLSPDDTGTNGRFTIVHDGKYPLYELNLRVADLSQPSPTSLEEATRTAVAVGNLPPKTARLLGQFPITSDSVSFNIFFNARNGFWTEMMRMRKIGEKWESAIRVTKQGLWDETTESWGPEFILLEKVSSGYPLTEGEVEWDVSEEYEDEK